MNDEWNPILGATRSTITWIKSILKKRMRTVNELIKSKCYRISFSHSRVIFSPKYTEIKRTFGIESIWFTIIKIYRYMQIYLFNNFQRKIAHTVSIQCRVQTKDISQIIYCISNYSSGNTSIFYDSKQWNNDSSLELRTIWHFWARYAITEKNYLVAFSRKKWNWLFIDNGKDINGIVGNAM